MLRLLLLPLLADALRLRPTPMKLDSRGDQMRPTAGLTRRSMLITTAAIGALGPATAAHAAYGAAQGAVTSLPQTNFERKSNSEQLDELETLNVPNRAKKISALSERDVDVLLRELDKRQVKISNEIQADVNAMIESGEQDRRLRRRLAEAREELSALNRKKKMGQPPSTVSEQNSTAAAIVARLDSEAERLSTAFETERLTTLVARLEKDLADLEAEEAASGKLREQVIRVDVRACLHQELRDRKVRLARLRSVRDSLLKRNTLLEALDAQPEWFNYAAAFLGSCVSTLIMHPVDTFKTRLIASRAQPVDKRPGGGNTGLKPPPKAPSGQRCTMNELPPNFTTEVQSGELLSPMADALKTAVIDVAEVATWSERETALPQPPAELEERKETMPASPLAGGFLSLYQGLPGALAKEGPPSALYLGVYEAIKVRLLATPTFEPYPILVYLIAGAVGEVVGSIVRAPAENIKARVQAGTDASSVESFRRVLFTNEGRSTVVRGWSVSLFRDVPFGAVQLAIFEGFKAFLLDSNSFDVSAVDGLALEALLGAIGGGFGALITTPPDVIALRILTQPTGEGQKPLGAIEMTKRIWAEDGFGAFWTGWQARTLYWAPAIVNPFNRTRLSASLTAFSGTPPGEMHPTPLTANVQGLLLKHSQM